MRQAHKPLHLIQLNLSLLNAPKATVSEDKQQELATALVELLLCAVQETKEENNGGESELKAHS